MSTYSAHMCSSQLTKPNLTHHAAYRAAHYNLSPDDIAYCLRHASVLHKCGDLFFTLRGADIPPSDRVDQSRTRLSGAVLVMAQDGWIKTVYRDARASRKIRRKPDDSWGFRRGR